jgi:hypothetical protein
MPKAQKRRAGKIKLVDGFYGLPQYDDPHDVWTAELLEFWLQSLPRDEKRLSMVGAFRPSAQLNECAASKRRRRKAA